MIEKTLKVFIKNVINNQSYDDEFENDAFRNRKKFIIILMFENNKHN